MCYIRSHHYKHSEKPIQVKCFPIVNYRTMKEVKRGGIVSLISDSEIQVCIYSSGAPGVFPVCPTDRTKEWRARPLNMDRAGVLWYVARVCWAALDKEVQGHFLVLVKPLYVS